jgi:hypothetical protein
MTHAGKMPPDNVLTDAEKDVIRDWIASGSAYTREPLAQAEAKNRLPWSFDPIKQYPIPTSRFDSLSSNPLDRFLFARLQKAGLSPSPLAGRRTLLRRVSIDLTGLPPTPAEIDAFLADKSPNAYEKVVDRLLASPRYGERWGRHWLDVVRYGESNGYEQNHLRANAWPYRDYVIRSFNQDEPYNQFITEQIAGDIVGRGNPDIEPATGFLVAGIHDTVGNRTEEGTRQQRANDLDDIAATTGVTFLGVSLNCARCHDHKFDPIPTRDYYRLTAVFSGVHHGERQLSPRPLARELQVKLDKAKADLAQNEEARRALLRIGRSRLSRANSGIREPVNSYHNEDSFAPVQARFVRFTITATNTGSEPCLDELEVYGAAQGGADLALSSAGGRATASSLLPGYDIHQISHLNDGLHGNAHSWVSNQPGAGWAQIELRRVTTVARVVWARDAEKKLTDRVPTGYRIEVSMDGAAWQQVASSADRSTDENRFSNDKIRMALNADQRDQLALLDKSRGELTKIADSLSPAEMAYCGTFDAPEPIHILPQGDVMRPGALVTPGALSLIPGLPGDFPTSVMVKGSSGASVRLAASNSGPAPYKLTSTDASNPRILLANWICDSRNPLTSRVIVNRLWEWHFGHGIVDTPSDFGNMGSLPSHPELLDWLASDFMSQGWKLKRLQRMIVTSYAYRQSSGVIPAALTKDADNRLVWHMPLRRMEAEAVRDSVLDVSGKLDLAAAGGPGYQLFKYSVMNVAIFEVRDDQGPDTWRRGVYQIPARGIRDELLGAFDCPDSSERAANRSSTTTALQSLSMLNGMFINQQAGFFADRVRSVAPRSSEQQVRAAFELAFGRLPTQAEFAAASALVHADGLETLCRGLYNANEFLYY